MERAANPNDLAAVRLHGDTRTAWQLGFWLHILRTRDVSVSLATFIRVGVIVTIPSLIVSLAVLWLVT